jgi:hypothetical protein
VRHRLLTHAEDWSAWSCSCGTPNCIPSADDDGHPLAAVWWGALMLAGGDADRIEVLGMRAAMVHNTHTW